MKYKRNKSLVCILIVLILCLNIFQSVFANETANLAEVSALVFPNSSFEETNAAGQPYKWKRFNSGGSFYITTKEEDVWEGNNALVITDPSNTRNCGMVSEMIPIKPNTTYIMYGMAKELTEGTMFSYDLLFYDENKVSCGSVSTYTSTTMTWSPVIAEMDAPGNAVWAQIRLMSGAKNEGSCAFDEVYIKESNIPAYISKEIDWKLKKTGHPRLYFDSSELDYLRSFAKDENKNTFGYSGKSSADALIKSADNFVKQAEEKVHYTRVITGVTAAPNAVIENGSVTLDYTSWDKIRDLNVYYKDIGMPVSKVGYASYPVCTIYFQKLREAFDTLSLAYVLTNDTKYSKLAISYAMDMSQWKMWADDSTYNFESTTPDGDMDTAVLAIGICSIYDMCYDQMTEKERETIKNAIIEKAAKPLYNGLVDRKQHNEFSNRLSGLVTTVCTIIDEENLDEYKPYLDRGYNHLAWQLHKLYYSKTQEGYHYGSHAMECTIKAIGHLSRVTGIEGLVDHPYFTEIFLPWTAKFLIPGTGNLPPISDSSVGSVYFGATMSVLSSTLKSPLAGFYLKQVGGPPDNFDKFLYVAEEPEIAEPENTLTHVEAIGYGGLRTGYEDTDVLLTMVANGSQMDHIHFDQNSFTIYTKGVSLAADPGYTNTGTAQDYMEFSEYYGHNVMFVDGKPQSIRGNGTLKTIIDSNSFGYLLGSAPGAYGQENKEAVLNKYDRHAILVNNSEYPYYILIDDIGSDKKREYSWNLNTGNWDEIKINNKPFAFGGYSRGTKFSVNKGGIYLFGEFVSDSKLDMKEYMHGRYGPTLLVDAGRGNETQLMTVLCVNSRNNDSDVLNPVSLISEISTDRQRINEGQLSWFSSNKNDGANIVRSVSLSGESLLMFRSGAIGDWMSFPIEVEKDGEYNVGVLVGKHSSYKGEYQFYIDDVPAGETVNSNGIMTGDVHPLGKHYLKAGKHIVKIALADCEEEIDPLSGVLVSVGNISLKDSSIADKVEVISSPVYVSDVYNNKDIIGGRISNNTGFDDIVIFSRNDNGASYGNVSSDGKLSAVTGIDKNNNASGFVATNATYMSYSGTKLFQSEKPINISIEKNKINIIAEDVQVIKLNSSKFSKNILLNGSHVEYKEENGFINLKIQAGKHTFDLDNQ